MAYFQFFYFLVGNYFFPHSFVLPPNKAKFHYVFSLRKAKDSRVGGWLFWLKNQLGTKQNFQSPSNLMQGESCGIVEESPGLQRRPWPVHTTWISQNLQGVHAKKLTRPLSMSYYCPLWRTQRDLAWPDGVTLAKQPWVSADELKWTVKFIEDVGLNVWRVNCQNSKKKDRPLNPPKLGCPQITPIIFFFFRGVKDPEAIFAP
jgi:hypothetical protein